ncbi:MAG: hypothetical protein ACC656_04555, partial [Candidatus Heimdallarchaeota archaeon]
VELAVPTSLADRLEDLIEAADALLKLKVSLTSSNSYIVRDSKTMLNIIHRRQESVAMLTDDKLLVEYIDSCWNNTSCCIGGIDLLDKKNILNLEILRD